MKSTARVNDAQAPFALPVELGDDVLKRSQVFLQKVQRADGLARALVLRGLFAVDNPPSRGAAIEAILKEAAAYQDVETRADRCRRALLKALVSEKQRQALRDLEDLVYEAGVEWGDAGYILGVAVGQRINLREAIGGAR